MDLAELLHCIGIHFGLLVRVLRLLVVDIHDADFAVRIISASHGELRATVGRTWEAASLGPPKMAYGPKKTKKSSPDRNGLSQAQ